MKSCERVFTENCVRCPKFMGAYPSIHRQGWETVDCAVKGTMDVPPASLTKDADRKIEEEYEGMCVPS